MYTCCDYRCRRRSPGSMQLRRAHERRPTARKSPIARNLVLAPAISTPRHASFSNSLSGLVRACSRTVLRPATSVPPRHLLHRDARCERGAEEHYLSRGPTPLIDNEGEERGGRRVHQEDRHRYEPQDASIPLRAKENKWHGTPHDRDDALRSAHQQGEGKRRRGALRLTGQGSQAISAGRRSRRAPLSSRAGFAHPRSRSHARQIARIL